MSNTNDPDLSLLCRVNSRLCALPVAHVVETMRALPTEPVEGMPHYLRGLAVIRGAPVPVVDAARLLGADMDALPTRFVLVRSGGRHVALAVDDLICVRKVSPASSEELPSLLRDAAAGVVSAIGTLDSQLLLVLRSARLVPEPLWDALAARGAL